MISRHRIECKSDNTQVAAVYPPVSFLRCTGASGEHYTRNHNAEVKGRKIAYKAKIEERKRTKTLERERETKHTR